MAWMMLLGKTWVRKPCRVKSPVFSEVEAPASGSARLRSAPGWNTLTSSSPSSSDRKDALTNHSMARRPMRPTARPSVMLARPDTSVAKTSGAMIILIRRRKMVVTMLK